MAVRPYVFVNLYLQFFRDCPPRSNYELFNHTNFNIYSLLELELPRLLAHQSCLPIYPRGKYIAAGVRYLAIVRRCILNDPVLPCNVKNFSAD